MKNSKAFVFCFLVAAVLTMTWLEGCLAEEKEKDMGKDKAWEIINTNIFKDNPGNKIVYVYNEPLTGGYEVKSWGKVYTVPENLKKTWFFFVDDQPDANWQHNCHYIFVDSETGKYTVIKSLTPPDSLEGMTIIYPKPNKN